MTQPKFKMGQKVLLHPRAGYIKELGLVNNSWWSVHHPPVDNKVFTRTTKRFGS